MHIYFAKLLFLVAAATFCNGALAQDTDLVARREMAAKVVQANMQALDAEKMLASIAESMKVNMVSVFKRSIPNQSADYYANAAEVAARNLTPSLNAFMLELMPSMLENMADRYVQKFTTQELAELAKINEIPIVRRASTITLESMPKVMEPMTQALLQHAELLARLTQALTRECSLPQMPKP